jgi:hypothetical protein
MKMDELNRGREPAPVEMNAGSFHHAAIHGCTLAQRFSNGIGRALGATCCHL